ncbi:MAG: 5,6-dimethylbenzimidazole synthase [Gemmataceae bacterium]|nr:5,6-dimethylbenzimidazole synthase [Gemmataceae bacterium]
MEPDEFSPADRDVVYRVIRARRDVRQFRSDPVPDAVLGRILDAAHAAPSVGFMQPWNFILIRSLETRRLVRALFEERNRQELEAVPDDARKELYGSFKLEGILESPLNVAVTCDRRRSAPFVLGRAPMPETDLFSTCLAVENLWLAARAEGVGVGWVSILDREATQLLLGLPDGVQLVAYLCVGYPLEFRVRPMLEETGWKGRHPLGELVFQERWGQSSALFNA